MRAELDYCVPLGVPHSVFLGRVVGPTDPQWLPTDRGYALAWSANKRATCTGCGTRADEWAADTDAFIGDYVYCEGCARLAQEQNNVPKDDGQARPGYHAYLAPKAVYEQLHPPGEPLPDHH